MDPKLRGYLQKQMHMVRHNFHLNDVDAIFIANFFYEAFQPNVYTIDQNLAAVFWTPDHVIFAGVYHIVVAFIFHECIIPLFAVYRKTIPPLTGEYGVPYIPMPEGRGFTAHLVNLAVRLHRSEDMIGEVILCNFSSDGTAELGCRLLPEHHGRGYGRDAFEAAASFAENTLHLKVWARCFRENTPSYRMIASSGFIRIREDRDFFCFQKAGAQADACVPGP